MDDLKLDELKKKIAANRMSNQIGKPGEAAAYEVGANAPGTGLGQAMQNLKAGLSLEKPADPNVIQLDEQSQPIYDEEAQKQADDQQYQLDFKRKMIEQAKQRALEGGTPTPTLDEADPEIEAKRQALQRLLGR